MDTLTGRLRERFPHAVPDGAGARLVVALVHGGRPMRIGLRLRALASGERRAVAVQATVGHDLVHRSLMWEPASPDQLGDQIFAIAREVAAARTALHAST